MFGILRNMDLVLKDRQRSSFGAYFAALQGPSVLWSSRCLLECSMDVDGDAVLVDERADDEANNYSWEQGYKRTWDVLQEDDEGLLQRSVAELEYQKKKKR